jgi:hypothetical protein
MDSRPAAFYWCKVRGVSCVFKVSIMDDTFLKERAARCRSLADKADQFTKRRLLDLAARYEGGMSEPSRASRLIKVPTLSPKDAPPGRP